MRIPIASPAHQLLQLKAAASAGIEPDSTSAPTPSEGLIRQLSGAAANRKRTAAPGVSRAFGKLTQRRARWAPAMACSVAPAPTQSGTIQLQPSSPERSTASLLMIRLPMKMPGQTRLPWISTAARPIPAAG